MYPANNEFYFVLSNLGDFYLFLSCLIAADRTSSTVLNKSAGSGHPCIIPDLMINTFSIYPLV